MMKLSWVKAREDSNFALFLPHLEKIIELRREYANCFAPYDHIYDPLLDRYEPGLKTKDVKEIFARIRPRPKYKAACLWQQSSVRACPVSFPRRLPPKRRPQAQSEQVK
jgi:Zn-dependent M32 family carboxypeptidase